MKSTNNQYDFSKLSESFQTLLMNPESMFQIFDLFPIPIEIFAHDGFTIFVNQASLDMTGVQDAGLLVGKYNVLNDPVCNDQLGHRYSIQRAFRGEYTIVTNFDAPAQDLVDRGIIKEKNFEKGYMDVHFIPVKNGERLAYVVCAFIVKSIYLGRPDVATAKEYMNQHWIDEFDPDAVAKVVNLSPAHLRSLFKQHARMTMYDYYKKVKVEHIKEKLADRSLSIAEVFNACGEDSRGAFVRTFKELTGMSPTEFRNSLK